MLLSAQIWIVIDNTDPKFNPVHIDCICPHNPKTLVNMIDIHIIGDTLSQIYYDT